MMKMKTLLTLTSSILLSACLADLPPIYTTPTVVQQNTIVQMPKQNNEQRTETGPIHVCTLKPFMTEYRSENANRGRAKLDVQKRCRAREEAMFCEEKDIVCTVYE